MNPSIVRSTRTKRPSNHTSSGILIDSIWSSKPTSTRKANRKDAHFSRNSSIPQKVRVFNTKLFIIVHSGLVPSIMRNLKPATSLTNFRDVRMRNNWMRLSRIFKRLTEIYRKLNVKYTILSCVLRRDLKMSHLHLKSGYAIDVHKTANHGRVWSGAHCLSWYTTQICHLTLNNRISGTRRDLYEKHSSRHLNALVNQSEKSIATEPSRRENPISFRWVSKVFYVHNRHIVLVEYHSNSILKLNPEYFHIKVHFQ